MGAVSLAAIAGCGSGDGVSKSSPSATKADPALESLVPDALKGRPVRIGTFPVIAPMEFTAADGKTLVGADIDLVKAIAARLGLKPQILESGFDGLIPGLQSGRFDMAIDSITDNPERQKAVDFVDYLREGSTYYYPKGANPVDSAADLCGRTAGAIKGTIYAEQIDQQARKCPKDKPLIGLDFIDQPAVNLAMVAKRVDVALADEPVAIWAVKRSDGQFELSGTHYGRAPLGIAFPKGSRLIPAVEAALNAAIKDGTYTSILRKWGLEAGAVSNATINGGR